MPKWWDRLARVDEKRWEKQRRLGFFGFVLVWGVGFWGLGSGILFTTAFTVATWNNLPLPDLIRIWLFSLGMWIAGGVWFGVIMWFGNEWLYKRQLREDGREPPPPGTGDSDAG